MSRHITRMTIEDAGHFTPEQCQVLLADYPEHERNARAYGVPGECSDLVFSMEISQIKVQRFNIPNHWTHIGGIDFGWSHPTAAVEIAWDRDIDIAYVIKSYKKQAGLICQHVETLKQWNIGVWSWPHDGHQHERSSGKTIAQLYRDAGLNMLAEHAHYKDGGYWLEPSIIDMHERLSTGRLKIFSDLSDWFGEYRSYRRENGRILKEYDDLISATRYALMMLRYARTKTKRSGERQCTYAIME